MFWVLISGKLYHMAAGQLSSTAQQDADTGVTMIPRVVNMQLHRGQVSLLNGKAYGAGYHSTLVLTDAKCINVLVAGHGLVHWQERHNAD